MYIKLADIKVVVPCVLFSIEIFNKYVCRINQMERERGDEHEDEREGFYLRFVTERR